MGTGIVSAALGLAGEVALSDALMWTAVGLWLALAAALARRLRREPGAALAGAGEPSSLAAVAATCVVGTRLTVAGVAWAGAALLAAGSLMWAALLGEVLRRRRIPPTGTGFLLAVGTFSLAVLAATLARAEASRFLVALAIAWVAAGLALYAVALARFDLRELLAGEGDHWIAGGAVAIGAFATSRLLAAGEAVRLPGGWHHALAVADVALWLVAAGWLVALVAAELARPRIRWSTLRWATVFPLGMYAAASITVGRAEGIGLAVEFGRAWAWVSLAAWVAAAALATPRAPRGRGRARRRGSEGR